VDEVMPDPRYIEPEIKHLTYQGCTRETMMDGKAGWWIYEFTDEDGHSYWWTTRDRGSVAHFGHLLNRLQKGDPIILRAKFGCRSKTYNDAPHQVKTWIHIVTATHFLWPRTIAVPAKRYKHLPGWLQQIVPERL